MNTTPNSERLHIGLFGRRNAGKSSLLNALTGQNLAITSPVAGTTTDPVQKAMELLPLGPVVLIDTPGLDDDGELGGLRIKKAYHSLHKTDLALLVVDSTVGMTADDLQIEQQILAKKIPYLIVYNKCDLSAGSSDTFTASNDSGHDDFHTAGGEKAENSILSPDTLKKTVPCNTIRVSTLTGENINELKAKIITLATPLLTEKTLPIVNDLVSPGDVVILVVPIDKAAPKGRLILPQQQTIRELLDIGAHTMIVRDHELADTFSRLSVSPRLVITDSQAFKKVAAIVPRDILLTSFSILMARHKGNFADALSGVKALSTITDQSRILISEGCTHHRQCGDIGTVKLPKLIQSFSNSSPVFQYTSGTEFPENLSDYDLIIHCGGCMLHDREMQYRYETAGRYQVPMTNYGLAISYMNGILARSIEILQHK